MLIYSAFYRQYGIRKWGELLSPRCALFDRFELPKESILHYIPSDEISLGIQPDNELIFQNDKPSFISHARELTVSNGNPRKNSTTADSLLRDYHRRFKTLRKVKNIETAIRDPRVLLIENYGLLNHLYRYTPSVFSQYYKWSNVNGTVWNRVNELADISDRHQFIVLNLPTELPTLASLRRSDSSLNKTTLEDFNESSALQIMDIWRWIGGHTENAIKAVKSENLTKVNFLIMDGGRWFVLNLNLIFENIKTDDNNQGKEPEMVQKYFLKALMTLIETRTIGDSIPEQPIEENVEDEAQSTSTQQDDEIEDYDSEETESSKELDLEEDLNSLEKINTRRKTEKQTITQNIIERDASVEEFLDDQINILADEGNLSGAEFKRLEKLKNKPAELKNPFGEGKLIGLTNISKEDLIVGEVNVAPDNGKVIDKSMLKSSVSDFDKKYLENIMEKDVVSMVLNTQKAGVIITDFKTEDVSDAVNHYRSYAIQVTPLTGSPTTLRFRLPIVNEDGSYIANGVKYRLRKQRGDVPIRKVTPSRVALTSYYGKVFVERSEKATNNYERWLLNKITELSLVEENPLITNVQLINVFDHMLKVPRLYSILSKRFKGFKANGIQFYFDYKTREDFFGKEAIEAESDGFVLFGKKGKTLYLVDNNNTLYTAGENGPSVAGSFNEVCQLSLGNEPVEIAEVKVFNKTITIGIALGYLLGIENLMDRLKIDPRRVPSGERLNLDTNEYALRFADQALVFQKDDPIANMVMGGFLKHHNDLKMYSLQEFNRKDVYLNVLESSGVQSRYIREMELMVKLFVDHITKELLIEMDEPTTFVGLLMRSCELLLTDWHPQENDLAYQRIKGYERLSGAVYSEMVRSLRVFNAKPRSSRNKVELNPYAVWTNLMKDPAQVLVEELNPIHNLKEKESVTFTGVGGRTARSMVDRTRIYNESDVGVISEGTVDSGDVAVSTFLSPNANFTSLRGITKRYDHSNPESSKLVSTSALLSPAADRDDQSVRLISND